MDSKYIINIHCKKYDDICKQMGVGDLEVDYKFGLFFVKTVQLDYIFEVRDKGKYLMAKLTYDI
jgi:hypothetical protein